MAKPTFCLGCGLGVTFDGELYLSGPRETRQDGVTPMEWPYNGSVAEDEFPNTGAAGLVLGNGLCFDHQEDDGFCRIFAFPNATARVEQGELTPIGVAVPDGWYWSLIDGAFDAPWNDTGVRFDLTDEVQIDVTNPSLNRPMIASYAVDVGNMLTSLDNAVGIEIAIATKVWDDPNVEPAYDIGSILGYIRGDSNTPGALSSDSISPVHYELNRKNGTVHAALATYMPPSTSGTPSITHFKAKLVAFMDNGTATATGGQFVTMRRNPTLTLRAITV